MNNRFRIPEVDAHLFNNTFNIGDKVTVGDKEYTYIGPSKISSICGDWKLSSGEIVYIVYGAFEKTYGIRGSK